MKYARKNVLFAVGFVPSVAVSVAAFFIVPWFMGVLASAGLAGMDGSFLPWPTRVLSATYRWWGIVALATLVLWLAWPVAARRGRAAATFGVTVSLVLFVFGVVGCYAPLFTTAIGR
ncbi:MAG: hypothetical protein ACREPY_17520 [Rhodanobacteraceae bacterium]